MKIPYHSQRLMIAYWKVYEEVGDYANLNNFAATAAEGNSMFIIVRKVKRCQKC